MSKFLTLVFAFLSLNVTFAADSNQALESVKMSLWYKGVAVQESEAKSELGVDEQRDSSYYVSKELLNKMDKFIAN